MSTIGERIKLKRKELGLTQAELGEKLCLSDRAVSKWEQGEGDPSLSIVPDIAKVLGVSLNYLLLGEEEKTFTLDDLDVKKRALYLIEKDDYENFEKYKYANPDILLNNGTSINSSIDKERVKLREKIIECQSVNIFDKLADKLLIDIKHGRYNNLYKQSCPSAAGLFFDYLNDFVKMCALTNKIEFLDFIKFKSFGIGSNQKGYFNNNIESFYNISQETLDFILSDKRIPKEMYEYVVEYKPFSDAETRSYDSPYRFSNMIRMNKNILVSLYKAGKYKEIQTIISSMEDNAKTVITNISSSNNNVRSSYGYISYGYLCYRQEYGYDPQTQFYGRIDNIDSLIEAAIYNKDKKNALEYSKYNSLVHELVDNNPVFEQVKAHIGVYEEKGISQRIKEIIEHETVLSIKNDTNITEYERRRQLFKHGALKLSATIQNDDYDLFVQFPFEETSQVSISAVANCSKDIRFFIYAANVGQKQNSLDDALNTILQNQPERYDILDVLLSAGAQVKDNPAMTAVLKQNILILNKQKELTESNVEIDAKATKEKLEKELEKKNYEYVIVNLTIQLEKKLKAKLGDGIQLLEMIDMAKEREMIDELECNMLHSLRKSRNSIVHQGNEKGFYTPELINKWIDVVYKI